MVGCRGGEGCRRGGRERKRQRKRYKIQVNDGKLLDAMQYCGILYFSRGGLCRQISGRAGSQATDQAGEQFRFSEQLGRN